MVREKVSRPGSEFEVIYNASRWLLLEEKRKTARRLMEPMRRWGLNPIVHGSVARGDVSPESDVDVFIPTPIPPYVAELVVDESGFKILERLLVQATPRHTPKAYLVLEPAEKVVVSFPLARLLPRELEFYYFGGALDLEGLLRGERRPGVNKRLELIRPTPRGHVAASILGIEPEVAKVLGVSLETVMERVRVLTRRDELGRTGVFVKRRLGPGESFEEALEELAARNPAVRKVLEERGGA
ncbi:MAG: nucleotidyltransferase domain-containing protein [Fervidicoccaceae archaeon]